MILHGEEVGAKQPMEGYLIERGMGGGRSVVLHGLRLEVRAEVGCVEVLTEKW
jgi:hypothetical protein